MSALASMLGQAFLAPAFLGFLGLLPVIVILYLLKLRRTPVVISSTYLWIKSLQDLTANAPFQRLRKNLLMFLQLLAVLLLAIALGRPFVRASGSGGANYCVILDRSASMQTLEDGVSRIELARRKALDMVDAMTRDDKMMVVAFAETAEVLCELTSDQVRLRAALRSIEATDTRTNLRDVMMIARSLAPDNPDIASVAAGLQLVLFSDGRLADLDEVGVGTASLSFQQIGKSTNNAGIVGFSVRAPAEGGDPQTFVLVHNEHTEALSATLTLSFNENALAVEEVVVAPGGDQEVLFSHPPLGEGLLKVELDHADSLAVDNRAWLTLQPAAQVRVLVVSATDSTSGYYLKRALSLEPRAEVSAISPESYAPTDDYDLTVFDGFAPAELPTGASVFFNALPPVPGLASTGTIEQPPVISWDANHFVMRFLNPDSLGVTSALRLTLPEGSRILVSSTGDAPLIADVSQGGRQVLVVAFDIAGSNWPLKLSFPLFLQNLISWTPRGAATGDSFIPTGKPIALFASGNLTEATVISPDGSREGVALDPARPSYFGGTQAAGVYTVEMGDERQDYAVNLLDRNESSIAPAESINLGRGEVAAERGPVRQTRELWRWLALAALAVLSLEWWIYSRRAWI